MRIRWWVSLALVELLLGCGGGHSGVSPPPVVVGFTVDGNIPGLETATIELRGTGIVKTTTTDVNGHYSFENVAPGSYSVTPSKTDTYFDPANSLITIGSTNVSANFTVVNVVDALPRSVLDALENAPPAAIEDSEVLTGEGDGLYAYAAMRGITIIPAPEVAGKQKFPTATTETPLFKEHVVNLPFAADAEQRRKDVTVGMWRWRAGIRVGAMASHVAIDLMWQLTRPTLRRTPRKKVWLMFGEASSQHTEPAQFPLPPALTRYTG